MTNFKKGELLKVKYFGEQYSSYETWMDNNASEYKTLWKENTYIYNGDEVVFLKAAAHEKGENYDIICLVLLVERARVVMIGINGLEKLN